LRVVSDLGAASISAYGIVVAVVLSATSLYRELELKTIFPILTRPIRRHEYLVGKYLGIVLTLAVFIAANSGALLLSLAVLGGGRSALALGAALLSVLLAVLAAWRLPRWRTYVPAIWAALLLPIGLALSSHVIDDRRVIAGAAALSLCEVAVVAAVATVFAAFSSPFLSAVFTFGVFVVGRSADTLAKLPERVFGAVIHEIGAVLSKVVPNLMVYVPPRPLLTGEMPGADLGGYLGLAALQALAWSVGLLTVASLIFRRRDFL
jgi:Cu-processing system permease protein